MTSDEFNAGLNGLVGRALSESQMSMGDLVSALEFAKSDVIEITRAMRAEAQRAEEQAQRPQIITPPGNGN
jgi:hypothetical protein